MTADATLLPLREEADHAPPRKHLLMLCVCAAPWIVGPLMAANTEGATLGGVAGPPCWVGALLPSSGCPGCGLTRSVVLALHGRLAEALAANPAGLLVLLVALGGLLVHGDVLRRRVVGPAHLMWLRLGRWLFAGGVLGCWLAREVC